MVYCPFLHTGWNLSWGRRQACEEGRAKWSCFLGRKRRQPQEASEQQAPPHTHTRVPKRQGGCDSVSSSCRFQPPKFTKVTSTNSDLAGNSSVSLERGDRSHCQCPICPHMRPSDTPTHRGTDTDWRHRLSLCFLKVPPQWSLILQDEVHTPQVKVLRDFLSPVPACCLEISQPASSSWGTTEL